MMASVNISQEIFAIDVLTALNSSLEHSRKHVLRLLRPSIKPGLHIAVMVVSSVANMFLALFQAVLIHVNTLITTSQASPAL